MPAIGDKVPDATVMITTAEGPGPVSSAELLGSGTVVLIGVPGAFTPICTDFPPARFRARGGPAQGEGRRPDRRRLRRRRVRDAWGRSEEAGEDFVMIADPDTAFATAMGMATDASSFGLGVRSERYAAILRDGVITSLDVESRFVEHEVSSAEAVLAKL